jgi:hypothetical protein
MSAGTHGAAEVQVALTDAQIGAPPDAPLAMPKQRLDRPVPSGRGIWAALLRPFLARTGRSEG